MGSEEGFDEVREQERAAREREAEAEGSEAQAQREDELPQEGEMGSRRADEDSVVPMDTDEERRGVVRPPEGA